MGKEENRIEKYLDQEVKTLGGFTRKYTSPGRKGVPDRIVFYKGVIFVEVKTITGVLSKLQEREIGRMRKQGAPVIIVSSTADADVLIRYMKEKHES